MARSGFENSSIDDLNEEELGKLFRLGWPDLERRGDSLSLLFIEVEDVAESYEKTDVGREEEIVCLGVLVRGSVQVLY